MTDRLVHVARDGKIIGRYPPEQLATLLESGQFFEGDFCYSDSSTEWMPLPEFLKKIEAPKYLRSTEAQANPTSGKPSRQDRHSGRRVVLILSGWIAFLLAVSALVGAIFWIMSLYGEIGRQSVRVQQMSKQLADKEKDYQKMLFAAREIAGPGIVRGSVILRNEQGKRIAMPGIQISLLARRSVEGQLEAKAQEAALLPAGTTVDAAEFFLAGMKPLASTTSDASGRYEFQVPDPGEYVVSTCIPSSNATGQFTRMWFVAFNSSDPLNTAVDITEANCVQKFSPSLMIVEGR